MKTFGTLVCVALVVLLLPLGMLFYRIDRYVMQPEPLLRAFQKSNVYEHVVPIATTFFLEDPEQFPYPALLQRLDEVFPALWIETQVTIMVREVFRLRDPNITIFDLHPQFSFIEPKAAAVAVLREELQNMKFPENIPVCTANELQQLQEEFERSSEVPWEMLANARCRPSEAMRQAIQDAVDALPLTALTNAIPDTLDLQDVMTGSVLGELPRVDATRNIEQFNAQVLRGQRMFTLARMSLAVLFIVLFLLLTVIAVMHRKQSVALLRWSAVVGVGSASLLLCMSLGMWFALQQIVPRALAQSALPQTIHAPLIAFTSMYLWEFLRPILGSGIIIGILGIGCLTAAVVLHRTRSSSR